MAVSYIRGDQFVISASVQGIAFPTFPTWQSKEGGDVTADSVETHPGGMLPAIALGGPAKRSDCTVKRLYTVDFHPYVVPLEAACGAARMFVSWTPLDANTKTPTGAVITITGILKEVQVPNTEANTASTAMLGLVMSCDQ